MPWAVVEVKHRRMAQPLEVVLPEMAKSRDLLGTVDHYAVINGSWYRADAGLRTLKPVDGPEPPRYGGYSELDDVDLATALVTDQLWRWADQQRREGRPEADYATRPSLWASAPSSLSLGFRNHASLRAAAVGDENWVPHGLMRPGLR